MQTDCYPTVEELTNYFGEELDKIEMTPELAEKWLNSNDNEDRDRLTAILAYYAKTDHEKAMMISEIVVSAEVNVYPLLEIAMPFLVRHKCERSEKLIIDYLIKNDPDSSDPIYMIADGYWS